MKKLYNKNHNKGIAIYIFLIIIGYVFFFISPLVFHETPDKQYTELWEESKFYNGQIIVNDWQYCPKRNAFEVCCSFKGLDISNDVKVTSSCNYTFRSKGTTSLKAETIYTATDYLVARIYGVPEDWYCASLQISLGNNSTMLSQDNLPEMDNFSSKESEDARTGTVYTCVDDVNKISDLTYDKSDNVLMVERFERNIGYDEKMISANNSEITQLKKEIKSYNDQIDKINSEKAFQVQTEIDKSNTKISDLQGKISQNQKTIGTLSADNVKMNKEISDYKTLIWKINSEKQGGN